VLRSGDRHVGGEVRAIVFSQTLPEGTPIQMLDAVTEEMGSTPIRPRG
jgi:hypothetical protein